MTYARAGRRGTAKAFDGEFKCGSSAVSEHWVDVPTSDRIWATSRDGGIALVTTGDGVFVREQ